MPNSPIARDVILEIGQVEEGNLTTTIPVIVGVDNTPTLENACRECDRGDIFTNEPKNSMQTFTPADFPRDGYEMKITGYTSVGAGSFNTNPGQQWGSVLGNGGFAYDGSKDNLFIFDMATSDGSDADFEGIYYANNNSTAMMGHDTLNRLEYGRENTEQGRILYLQPNMQGGDVISDASGIDFDVDFCLSFEIVAGWDKKLCVRGTGMENPANYLNAQGVNISLGQFWDTTQFLGKFNCFISPYVHNAHWFYRNNAITYNPAFKAIHMSWITEWNGDKKYSPTFTEQGMFGVRSMGMLLLQDGCAEEMNMAGASLEFEITEIEDCEVNVIFGSGGGNPYIPGGMIGAVDQQWIDMVDDQATGDTSITPFTWENFTTKGKHQSCTPMWRDTSLLCEPNMANSWFQTIANVTVCTNGPCISPQQQVAWQSQHEFLRIVETGSNPTVTISGFKVKEVDATLGERLDDIWGTQDIDESIYTYTHLDILDKTESLLALTFKASDLTDPSKRAAGYSKTFEIPASNHNQRFLKTLTGVGAERSDEQIGWYKARIKANGLHVFSGWCRIEQSITGQGGRYKAHILQDPTHWPQLIKKLKICDLPFPTHNKTYQTIVESWTKTADQIDYCYPVISYGEWVQPANQGITLEDFHPAVYAISIVNKIFDNIGYTLNSDFMATDEFKKLIIPYSSGEDYNNATDPLGDSGSLMAKATWPGETGPGTITAVLNSYTYKQWWPKMPYENDPSQLHVPNSISYGCNNGYTAPFTGRYKIHYDAQMKISQGFDKGRWAMCTYVNGSRLYSGGTGASTSQNSIVGSTYDNSSLPTAAPYNATGDTCHYCLSASASDGDWKTCTIDFEMDLQTGDVVQFGWIGKNWAYTYNTYSTIKNQNMHWFPLASNTAMPDSIASISAALPCIKQLDFIKGITNMFNLYWTSDEQSKTISVEPYDTFYGSGKVIDWSDKLDHESWSDKFLIDELASTIVWKYKVDSNDRVAELYALSTGNELWSLTLTNGALYRKDDKDMGNKIFSPTMQIANGDRTWGTTWSGGPVIPAMWEGNPNNWGWFNSEIRPEASFKFNIRILNFAGLSTTTLWKFTDSSGTVHDHYSYPYAYTYKNNALPSISYDDNLSWYNIGSGSSGANQFVRGLFDRYYGGLYEKISGGAALRSCMMNLSANDISQLDLRDRIKLQIDGVYTYWTINNIKDYKPGRDELTKVELVEWKYSTDSAKGVKARLARTEFGGDGKGRQTETNESGLTFINNISKEVLSSNPPIAKQSAIQDKSTNGSGVIINTGDTRNNSVAPNSVAIGSNLMSSSNQIVIGNNNEYKSSDIFQVGSGVTNDSGDIVNQNAISINQDGEFSIFGGEVIAEFKVGGFTILGDIYIKQTETIESREDGTVGNDAEQITRKKLYLK